MNTKEIRKRKGFYFCLLAFTSVLLLLLLSVVSLFWPTRRFSASERRNLAQRPKLSYEGIVDGTFSNEVESYLADQYPAEDFEFIFRTQFTTSKLCHACTDSIMDFKRSLAFRCTAGG